MARITIPSHVNCPHCAARNPSAGERCGSCGRPLTLYIGPPEHFPRRLDLGSLMWLIALIAVCLGVTREVPALGVFLLAIAVPALLRTFVWVARQKEDGQPMFWPEKLGAFAACAGIVWLILLGAVAGFAMAFAIGSIAGAALQAIAFGAQGNGQAVLFASVPLGCIGGVLAGYYLVKALWPIKD
ncbi:MAG: hypothetical protein P4L84_37180 [Isosphaeraceae bacterium]|nr:hypothetical protein [Isosphaeraceae bacterium]